jgi:signal transduction histidine kinase
MALLTDLKRWRLGRHERRQRLAALRPFRPSIESSAALALVELSRGVSTDWEGSIRRIVQFDSEVLHVERVSFWSLAEETSSIHCDAGYVASRQTFEHGATLLSSEAPDYFAAMRKGRTMAMGDVDTDPRCRGLRDYCAARGIASMLDVPVWVEGRLAGVVCHEHVGARRTWTAKEEVFATGVGQVVASALSSRAHTRAEATAQRAAFLDTASRVLSSLDAREIGRRAVCLCVPKFADAALVWLLDRDGNLECVAVEQTGMDTQGLTIEGRRITASESDRESPTFATLVVRQRQSLLIPDLSPMMVDRYRLRPEDRAALERRGLRTAMGVPLAVAGSTFGALVLLARARRYDVDDLALAENVANRVASALENARLYEVAREAIRARDELLVLAAHELRTPLTALQLMTDVLQRKCRRDATDAPAASAESIARQVRRFSALVDHMLDALNIRAEGVLLTRAPCDLATMVQQAVKRVAGQAAGGISLDGSPPVVGRWDRARIEQVIGNLLDNAIKFSDGKPIEVALRVDGGEAELSVRDQGIGIPEDRLSSIFHPFERAVPKEQFGGLGLGLYIAKAIVDAHGGAIAVTSRPGEGATFSVRLPLSA